MPTAFVATFGAGEPVIGFLGEYDALLELSQEAVPQKEAIVAGGPGHGCGHNLHRYRRTPSRRSSRNRRGDGRAHRRAGQRVPGEQDFSFVALDEDMHFNGELVDIY